MYLKAANVLQSSAFAALTYNNAKAYYKKYVVDRPVACIM